MMNAIQFSCFSEIPNQTISSLNKKLSSKRIIMELAFAFLCLIAFFVLGFSASPVAAVAPTTTSTPSARPSTTRMPTATRPPTSVQPTKPAAVPSPTAQASTKTSVRHNGNQFALLVNGQPTYIKGLNYNVNYTELPVDQRLKLHRRDFKIMRDMGVNAIVGWGIYDEITLQVADEFGIGVIMPFDLPANGDYDNANYRNQIKSDFREYVQRFRDYRAVWGWNPGGDELLYRMDTEEHRTEDKLQYAADLELEMVLLAQSLDPNHFNLIKEPRDWYIKYLGTAMSNNPTNSHNLGSNLIYGVNVYGRYADIEMALSNAKITLADQLGLTMMVSEFGPFNSPREERAIHYAGIWNIVTRISDVGGLAYVFGPDQPNPNAPNPYDPLALLPNQYSLVDVNGTPIDNALDTLTTQWHKFPVHLSMTGNSTTAP
jgi:hypothetical protein